MHPLRLPSKQLEPGSCQKQQGTSSLAHGAALSPQSPGFPQLHFEERGSISKTFVENENISRVCFGVKNFEIYA